MASNDEYQQRQFFEQNYLHPNISHINFSGNPSTEQLMILNKLVDRLSKMTTDEIKNYKP